MRWKNCDSRCAKMDLNRSVLGDSGRVLVIQGTY